jgi:hypothetical protein
MKTMSVEVTAAYLKAARLFEQYDQMKEYAASNKSIRFKSVRAELGAIREDAIYFQEQAKLLEASGA